MPKYVNGQYGVPILYSMRWILIYRHQNWYICSNYIYISDISALQETGELEKLRQKWFEAESLCSDEDGSSGDESTSTAQGLEMQNVAGVFYILVMGAALSILTSLLEVIWYRFLQIPKFESNHSVLPPVKVWVRSKKYKLENNVFANVGHIVDFE